MRLLRRDTPRNDTTIMSFVLEFMGELFNSYAPPETLSKVLDHLLGKLKEGLGKNLISVVLYGSCARGQMGPESDVDLLIIAKGLPDSSLDRQALFTKILQESFASFKEVAGPTAWSPYISALLKTPQEADRGSRIYFDMLEEAKILFDQEDFFKDLLKRVRLKLEKLGARKVQVGRMWYWDLKPDYRPGDIFEI